MSNFFIEVASNANRVFTNSAVGDVVIYTLSNAQKMFMGSSNAPVPTLSFGGGSNVGVFNSNPVYSLDVSGTAGVTGTNIPLRVNRTSISNVVTAQFTASNVAIGSNTGIYIGKNANNYNGFNISHNHKGLNSTANVLSISPSGYPSKINLAVQGTGNVGIGLSTPSYLLDVAGQMRLSTYTIATPNRPYIRGYFTAGAGGGYIPLNLSENRGGLGITSSTQVVAPISGVYRIGFTTLYATNTGRQDLYIYVNGAAIAYTLSEDYATGYHYRCAGVAYYLNANDYVQFWNNSTALYGGTNDNPWRTFYVYLVG